jgi:Glycoside hydrolase family 5 C-terminal domain/Cellulase (glycosyl hydrolase family 5)
MLFRRSRSAAPRTRVIPLLGFALATMAPTFVNGCSPDDLKEDPVPLTRVHTDRTYLRDAHGRYSFFHGVNVSGSNKVPTSVDPQTDIPTYVGKPFPLEIADREMKRLADKGFNSIRLLVMWEGVEPERRGQYDEEYLAYIRRVVEIAQDHGIYVLMDFHQDMFTRHLSVKYNENPKYGEPGSIEATLTSLVPPYTDSVKGDGAPRWAVEACLPEKDISSPNWGIPRLVSGLGPSERAKIIQLYQKLTGSTDTGEVPEWISYISDNAPPDFPVNETTDMLPFTNWGVASALSADVERMYGCIFAGDVMFPGLEAEGVNIKDYLQEAYANAWKTVAARVADMPNVIGYDIMNEPQGNFIILTALAGAMALGVQDGARQALIDLMDEETGALMYDVVTALRLIPPDTEPETLELWGLDKVDAFAVLGMNLGFDRNYVAPFYSRVGQAIQSVDPDAVIWIEPSMNITTLFGAGGGVGGMWDQSMTHPEGINQLVFAPHVYADIYPFIGFNQAPRDLSVEEVRYRDYTEQIEGVRSLSYHALGNVPVVFGEFGTYFNFNGIEKSVENDYIVSEHVLDNYYESFEGMFQSQMLWCYSPENDYQYGDLWNKEDFSIIDPNDQTRGEGSWSRPFARFTAGKPISTHFYSNLHYFDPDKGQQIPLREFEVRYMSKETDAPTEIFVPQIHYPDGFYVWVSDGRCYYDPKTRVLYHYPELDDPKAEHWVRMLPPLPGEENEGWDYFFDGPRVVKH